MFPPLSLLLSIFVIYPKEKMKENDFFFFWKFFGMPRVHRQQYPKGTSTQKISGTGTAPFLEYLCFIDQEFYFTKEFNQTMSKDLPKIPHFPHINNIEYNLRIPHLLKENRRKHSIGGCKLRISITGIL